jgi:hypothetical protein
MSQRCHRQTLASRLITGSLAQVTSHPRDVTSQERGQDHMNDDRGPQQNATQTTCETEVRQIQRYRYA